MTKNFAIIGVGGYIAPRHLEAIKNTGNRLLFAYDVNDSVGILDRYFPQVKFYNEFELLYDALISSREKIDYFSICSPNYLHKAHMNFALQQGANAICEKPLVLTAKDLDALEELEQKSGKKIYTILQLRLHSAIQQLKQKFANLNKAQPVDIELTYITSRGPWYDQSWKANQQKAGGIVTNIGVHFFDMIAWIFGKQVHSEVHYRSEHTASGFLELEHAKISWFLSIDRNTLPQQALEQGKATYRSLLFNGEELEFSEGFTDLHLACYNDVLSGGGYGLAAARSAIEMTENIRDIALSSSNAKKHRLLKMR